MSYPLPPERPGPGTGERVVSWLLYAVMLFGVLILGILSIFSVFATDSCGSSAGRSQRICDPEYFDTIILVFWGVLGGAAVLTLVLMIVANVRGNSIWYYPVAGLGVLVVSTIGYLIALSQ